jgi:hypothetical protein
MGRSISSLTRAIIFIAFCGISSLAHSGAGMADQKWQLIPGVGIQSGAIKISFGQERAALGKLMSTGFLPAKSYAADEDDFLTRDQSTLIRVRYHGTQVEDIELLRGTLQYQGIDLHANTTFAKIKKEFAAKNWTFRETTWLGDGKDCPELKINIATHEDVGGDGDEIEWVILGKDFN